MHRSPLLPMRHVTRISPAQLEARLEREARRFWGCSAQEAYDRLMAQPCCERTATVAGAEFLTLWALRGPHD